MALPMIETGYKPEFGLGAVYQGFNAANADNSAELEIIKQFLANQREQQMQPLDVNIKQTESNRATIARSPEMLDAYQRGYIGQNNSQDAAGKKALATLNGDIALTNATNKNKLTHEELLNRLNTLKKSTIESVPSMGFQMQPQQQKTPNMGFSWQIPPEQQKERDLARLDILRQEKQLYPNDVMLDKELKLAEANIDKTPSTPQKINANDSPLVPQPPKRNGGVTPGSTEYESVMMALVDTPEFRQRLLQGDQKLDSAEFQALLRLAGQRESGSKGGANKDPYQEFFKLTPEKRLGVMEWAITGGINPVTRQPFADNTEKTTWLSMYNQDLATYNARNASNAKEGSVSVQDVTNGAVKTRPAVTAGTPKIIGNGMPIENRSGQGTTKSGNKYTITKE